MSINTKTTEGKNETNLSFFEIEMFIKDSNIEKEKNIDLFKSYNTIYLELPRERCCPSVRVFSINNSKKFIFFFGWNTLLKL